MGINRIDFAGTTLIDISQDTATESDVLTGKTFHKADGTQATGSATAGTDTSDATATAADILTGKTAYANGSKLTGSYTPPEDFEYLVDYDKRNTLHTYDLTGIKQLREAIFSGCTNVQVIQGQLEIISSEAFKNCNQLTTIDLTNVKYIASSAFTYCSRLNPGLIHFKTDDYAYATLNNYAFEAVGNSLSDNWIAKLQCTGQNRLGINNHIFTGCNKLEKIYIYPCTVNPVISTTAFDGTTNLTDIYVPWSEGEVAGAPFGAGSGVTVHYDTTYDASGEPV